MPHTPPGYAQFITPYTTQSLGTYSPQQQFIDAYNSGDQSRAHNTVSQYAPTVSIGGSPEQHSPTINAMRDVYRQYLAFFGLADSGVGDIISQIPSGPGQHPNQGGQPPQQPPSQPPQFASTLA